MPRRALKANLLLGLMNEETCSENILESLYQQLKTLQYPAVREALRATPRGKNVTSTTVESGQDVAQLQAIAIALKNELVRTSEQMEHWKQLYEQREEEHREGKLQWEQQCTQLTEQCQDAKARYEESEWRHQETQREWEEWKDKAIQEIEYWKQRAEKSTLDLAQLRKTLDEVQANKRRVEDTWKREVGSLQQQISKLQEEKEQLSTQVETLGNRWKLTIEELEEERLWNKELTTQLEQANERCRQYCHSTTTTVSPSMQEKIDQQNTNYSQRSPTTVGLEQTNKLLQRELNDTRKQMETLKWELTEAEEAKNSLEVLREQSNELLHLVYAMTGVRDVEEAMKRLKELSYTRNAQQDVENERETAIRSQMEETIAALRDELQQNKHRHRELEKQCERQILIRRLLENERDGLKNILNEWDANMVNDQDGDNQLLVEKMKLLQSQYSEMEATLKRWEIELSEKDRLLSSLKSQIEEWNEIKSAEGSSQSVIQSLRINLMSSRRTKMELQQQKEELEQQLNMLTQKYEQLLSTVEEYKNKIDNLQQVVDAQKRQQESREDYETQIKLLQEAVQSLEKHIGSGYFNPTYTKVVHLKGGPPMVINERYLGESNKHPRWMQQQDSDSFISTKEQISPRDEQSSCTTWNALSLPAEKWREKAFDAEKRAQRTRQVAKAKINEFRETCYHLFGWKINVVGAQYRLSSMYAESSNNETLCFGRNELGGVELLETEYCYTIRNEIEQYCARWNSIPALLAAITLENFQKTTAFQQQA